mmetsp:Transcript_13541/g.37563  ORF Transcript_13541/g.37563 Transcript_13541/m.37563 type:complete len:220 (+) Transcript_13541:256-915(+)
MLPCCYCWQWAWRVLYGKIPVQEGCSRGGWPIWIPSRLHRHVRTPSCSVWARPLRCCTRPSRGKERGQGLHRGGSHTRFPLLRQRRGRKGSAPWRAPAHVRRGRDVHGSAGRAHAGHPRRGPAGRCGRARFREVVQWAPGLRRIRAAAAWPDGCGTRPGQRRARHRPNPDSRSAGTAADRYRRSRIGEDSGVAEARPSNSASRRQTRFRSSRVHERRAP